MAMPGVSLSKMVVTLMIPPDRNGRRSAFRNHREGGRTVTAGVVAKFSASVLVSSFELKGRFGARAIPAI